MWNPDKKVEDINKVPENLRGLYEEKKEGDKTFFVLKADILKTLEAPDLKDEIEKLKKELKETKDKKINSSEIDALKAKLKEAEDKLKENPPATGEKPSANDEALKTALNELEANKKMNSELSDQNKQILSQMQAQKKSSQILDAIREAGGVPTLLSHHIEARTALDKEGNIFIKDKDGGAKFINANKMTLPDLLAEMKEDENFKLAFKNKTEGPGSHEFKGKGKDLSETKFSELNQEQKVKFFNDYGKEAFEQAQKALTQKRISEVQAVINKHSTNRF